MALPSMYLRLNGLSVPQEEVEKRANGGVMLIVGVRIEWELSSVDEIKNDSILLSFQSLPHRVQRVLRIRFCCHYSGRRTRNNQQKKQRYSKSKHDIVGSKCL